MAEPEIAFTFPVEVEVAGEPAANEQAAEHTYTFPVEVEMVGELSAHQLRAVAEHVFDELDVALRARG